MLQRIFNDNIVMCVRLSRHVYKNKSLYQELQNIYIILFYTKRQHEQRSNYCKLRYTECVTVRDISPTQKGEID